MNNAPIGVFDSGLGGLTAVKELNRILPHENIVYFGDTARLPYGSRSRETILKYAEQDVKFIKQHNVKYIIAACGTVSSAVGQDTHFGGDIPFTGVVLPAAQAASTATRTGRIGVIGTSATIKSGAYGRAIRAINPEVSVIGNACPLFVHLVECGFTARDNKITRLAAEQYLKPIRDENVDVLIMGCTHYPVIKDIIADYMGSDVTLISPGEEAAKHVLAALTESESLADREEAGEIKYYSSDSPEMFAENAHSFLGGQFGGNVERVSIDELTSL